MSKRARVNKVHMLRPQSERSARQRETYCGLRGWASTNFGTEFETLEGNRFEISRHFKEVTCQRCRPGLTDNV